MRAKKLFFQLLASQSFRNKCKAVISLYQVVGSMGVVFDVHYPAFYVTVLSWLSVLELDVFEFMPVNCVLHLTFYHELVVSANRKAVLQTATPVVCIRTPRELHSFALSLGAHLGSACCHLRVRCARPVPEVRFRDHAPQHTLQATPSL